MSLYPLLSTFATDLTAGPLPPLLHNTTSLEAAVRGNTLGTGYASGGFLVFYYIGVSKVLQQLGIVKVGFTSSAGASIGSIVQGLDQGIGQHDDIIYNHSIAFCNKCRQQRSCFQTLDTEFTKLTQHIIGTNKEATKKVLGKGCVVVSRGNLSEARAEGVCQFKDVDDLLQAIRASSYVPGWSGKASSIMFRGQPAFDGAFSQYIPCPPGVTFCIKVSGLPVWDTGRAISSLAGGELLPTLNLLGSTVSNILGAQPLQSLQRAVNEDLVGTMGLQTWFKVFATIQRPGLFDIYPGKFGRSPLTQTQWALYMLTPPPKEVILQMYQAGQDDARTWAKQMGWPKA